MLSINIRPEMIMQHGNANESVMVLPAEVPLITHFLPHVNRPVAGKHLLDLATLLVLTSLPSREVFQSLTLLTHTAPEIFVFLDDAVV